MKAELKHGVIAALVCFALLVGAGMTTSGLDALNWRWLGSAAIIAVLASVADVFIRSRRKRPKP